MAYLATLERSATDDDAAEWGSLAVRLLKLQLGVMLQGLRDTEQYVKVQLAAFIEEFT